MSLHRQVVKKSISFPGIERTDLLENTNHAAYKAQHSMPNLDQNDGECRMFRDEHHFPRGSIFPRRHAVTKHVSNQSSMSLDLPLEHRSTIDRQRGHGARTEFSRPRRSGIIAATPSLERTQFSSHQFQYTKAHRSDQSNVFQQARLNNQMTMTQRRNAGEGQDFHLSNRKTSSNCLNSQSFNTRIAFSEQLSASGHCGALNPALFSFSKVVCNGNDKEHPSTEYLSQRGEAGNEEEREDCDNDEDTMEDFLIKLTFEIEQMMFVSGEQGEPSAETTWMIEEIVREQVVEMLKEASGLANRRGSKSISIVDLIFQIRHNPAKVSRLKTFLSWKDVRKNVKDSDDKAGADADALDLEDGALPGANPAAPQKTQTNKKAKLVLPWEVQSFYNETVPEREDEEDEEEEEQNEATLARLASADERTKNMTRDEYVYWSDCRQASFTFRKGKRFREWAGFGTIIDSKPNDDVVDILGFLTFEIVQTLTEEALKVKNAEDLANKRAGRGDNEASKKRKREGCTLFEMPEEGRTPVEPKHVQEAFRRLQAVPNRYKYMRQGRAGTRTPLRMI